MDLSTVLRIGSDALYLILILSGPALLAALGVGLVVSVFQAATQIQEQTLTFVPKICAVVVILVLGGYWMIGQLLRFTTQLVDSIPHLLR